VYSGAPCPLDPGQINRGDYCHRYSICTAKKKIDPNQAVCLICNDFLPLFPGVDPLAQARVMGFTVRYKTIKAALAFEAARSGLAAAPSPAPEPTPIPKPKLKLNGYKPRSMRPKPEPGQKRCSNPACKNPILPATPEYFFRIEKYLETGWTDVIPYFESWLETKKKKTPATYKGYKSYFKNWIRRSVSARQVVNHTKTDHEHIIPCHRNMVDLIDHLARQPGQYLFEKL
jgi:hypothetical protein